MPTAQTSVQGPQTPVGVRKASFTSGLTLTHSLTWIWNGGCALAWPYLALLGQPLSRLSTRRADRTLLPHGWENGVSRHEGLPGSQWWFGSRYLRPLILHIPSKSPPRPGRRTNQSQFAVSDLSEPYHRRYGVLYALQTLIVPI